MKLDFKMNLGNFDRIIRVMLGVYLIWLVVSGIAADWWAVIAIGFALSQFVEAFLAY